MPRESEFRGELTRLSQVSANQFSDDRPPGSIELLRRAAETDQGTLLESHLSMICPQTIHPTDIAVGKP